MFFGFWGYRDMTVHLYKKSKSSIKFRVVDKIFTVVAQFIFNAPVNGTFDTIYRREIGLDIQS